MPCINCFIKLLKENYFCNCPVTPEDAKIALKIWGKDKIQQAGRLTRPNAHSITILKPSEQVKTIVEENPYTNIAMDYVFIMGVAFLHTTSIEFTFRTTEAVVGRKLPKEDDIEDQVKKVIKLYQS